eukprot:Nk52_evm73s221 gene=Nk52_evmTU73s221
MKYCEYAEYVSLRLKGKERVSLIKHIPMVDDFLKVHNFPEQSTLTDVWKEVNKDGARNDEGDADEEEQTSEDEFEAEIEASFDAFTEEQLQKLNEACDLTPEQVQGFKEAAKGRQLKGVVKQNGEKCKSENVVYSSNFLEKCCGIKDEFFRKVKLAAGSDLQNLKSNPYWGFYYEVSQGKRSAEEILAYMEKVKGKVKKTPPRPAPKSARFERCDRRINLEVEKSREFEEEQLEELRKQTRISSLEEMKSKLVNENCHFLDSENIDIRLVGKPKATSLMIYKLFVGYQGCIRRLLQSHRWNRRQTNSNLKPGPGVALKI